MAENVKSAATIALTILLGIGLQVVMAMSEMTDTPGKAATEFVEAYFHNDEAMKDRLCADLLDSGEGDVVAAYINKNIQEAAELGYSTCYAGDWVKHVTVKTVSKGQDSAVLEVEAKLKNSLRSFFTGEKAYEIHEEFQMVKEDGQWKVCGNPFMIAGADYVVAAVEADEAETEEAEAVEGSDEEEENEEEEEDEES